MVPNGSPTTLEQRGRAAPSCWAPMPYPAIVSGHPRAGDRGFLVTYVCAPQVAGVFTSSKAPLPLLTVMMMVAVSGFARHWGWPPALLAAATRHGLRACAVRGEAFRRSAPTRCSRACRWPAAWRAATTRPRLCGTLAMLAQRRRAILKALRPPRRVGNRAMRADAAGLVLVREAQGLPLANAGAAPALPAVGDVRPPGRKRPARLPVMLQRAATPPSEVQRCADAGHTLLEPLFIVVMTWWSC